MHLSTSYNCVVKNKSVCTFQNFDKINMHIWLAWFGMRLAFDNWINRSHITLFGHNKTKESTYSILMHENGRWTYDMCCLRRRYTEQRNLNRRNVYLHIKSSVTLRRFKSNLNLTSNIDTKGFWKWTSVAKGNYIVAPAQTVFSVYNWPWKYLNITRIPKF